jgi:hypothetical protein
MIRNLAATSAMFISLATLCASTSMAEDNGLSGRMLKLEQLLGTWSCGDSVTTYAAVPGNTIHEHSTGAQESDDSYFAFNPALMAYQMTGADSSGFHWFFLSADGTKFSGKQFAGLAGSHDETLIYHISEKAMTTHQDTAMDDGRVKGSDTVCSRRK